MSSPFWRGAAAVGALGIGALSVLTASYAPSSGPKPANDDAQSSDARTFAVSVDSAPDFFVCGPGYIDPTAVAGGAGPAEILGAPGADLTGGAKVVAAASGQAFAVAEAPEGVFVDECIPPATTLAVVGGSTKQQESVVLSIANPAAQPVDVSVRGFGAAGELLGPSSAFTIPAGTVESRLVDALFPEQDRLGLLIEADGRGVGAWLQTSGKDGEVPLGVARTAATQLATQQVFPAVDEALGKPVMQILNPKETDTTVSITTATGTTAKGNEVEPLPGAEEVPISAGTVVDVPLTGIGKDPVSVIVEGDSEFAASISYRIRGNPDPVVKGERIFTRTLVSPAAPSTGTSQPDETALAEAMRDLGIDNPKIVTKEYDSQYRALRIEGKTDAGRVLVVVNLGAVDVPKVSRVVTIGTAL